MAAERLNVPVEQLNIDDGVIRSRTEPQKNVAYGELVGGKRLELSLDSRAKRRPRSEWRILGTSVPRAEIPDLVTGSFEHVHNVRVPGMLHARVVRPPAVGVKLVSVDEDSVADIEGTRENRGQERLRGCGR